MTGGWITGGGWMIWGCWLAHPAASNMAAPISDRNFTLRSLAPFTPCARRRYRCDRFMRVPFHDDRRRYSQATAPNQRRTVSAMLLSMWEEESVWLALSGSPSLSQAPAPSSLFLPDTRRKLDR